MPGVCHYPRGIWHRPGPVSHFVQDPAPEILVGHRCEGPLNQVVSVRRAHELWGKDGTNHCAWARAGEGRLPVALVALPARDLRLGLLSTIGRERFADIVRFLETAVRTAPNESLVGAGVDQFALGGLPRRAFRSLLAIESPMV